MKPLRVWCIVIGRDNPYVACGDDLTKHDAFSSKHRAYAYRRRLLGHCGHREVFVRKFEEVKP
jgi:hypothetical protein